MSESDYTLLLNMAANLPEQKRALTRLVAERINSERNYVEALNAIAELRQHADAGRKLAEACRHAMKCVVRGSNGPRGMDAQERLRAALAAWDKLQGGG